MKKISDYMTTKKKKESSSVHVRVNPELRDKAEQKLKKHGKTWVDLVTAALTAYLKE